MHMYMNVDINDMTLRFSCEEEMALQGSACKNDCDESKQCHQKKPQTSVLASVLLWILWFCWFVVVFPPKTLTRRSLKRYLICT